MRDVADAIPFPGDWEPTELANTGAWTLGRVWIDRARGRICMRVGPEHCNALGVMHGGAMATFADAQIVAVRPCTGDPKDHTPTISLTVDYLAPAPEGGWLLQEAAIVRTTRTMFFTQAIVTIDGAAVARTNAIYRNPSRKGT